LQNNPEQKKSVLIVGAGAMGLVAGYHLALAGAEITFLVRPGRVAGLVAPQTLYCYDDNKLKIFTGYNVISDIEGADPTHYDYVMVTLDGSTARSAEGTALLKAIGDAIRPTAAEVIIGGVGAGLRAHFLSAMDLPSSRVLNGVLGVLSYQVDRANLPAHPPADPALIAQASMAYRHFSKNGFILDSTNPASAKAFAALYNQCGVSHCTIMNKTVFAMFSKIPFPLFAVSELAGWPALTELAKNKPLRALHGQAVREIARLSDHGLTGKAAALALTDGIALKIWTATEKSTLPMDFVAFNKFHHGGKVKSQDILVMRECVALGEAQGAKMTALKEILARLAEHDAKSIT
jgi:ketopantoate reductase